MILYYFEEFQYGKDSQIPQHLDVLMGGAYSERMFFFDAHIQGNYGNISQQTI